MRTTTHLTPAGRRTTTSQGRAAATLAVVVSVCAAASPSFAASSGFTIDRKNGEGRERIVVSSEGYAHFQLTGNGKRDGGILIDYRKRTVTIVDIAGKRFQRLRLAAAVARQQKERRLLRQVDTPYFELPDNAAFPVQKLRRLAIARRIKGLRARAYRVTRGRQPASRVWYSTAVPRPPTAVRRLLRTLAPRGGSALAGNVALRSEVRVGRRFRRQLTVTRLRRARIPRSAFSTPRGLARTTTLLPPLTSRARRLRSVPAQVARQIDWFPVQDEPEVFAVYWGRRFATEPNTVRRINQALSGTIMRRPYVEGLRQYGVGEGRLIGSMVIDSDPPPEAGERSFAGWSANSTIANAARERGAPFAWSRTGTDPLVMIFVPMEGVNGNDDNLGYHTVMPIELALLDPLGVWLQPVYPWAVVKVPAFDAGGSYVDGATATASHETVETATDPVPIPAGFVDASKAALGEQGEVADICQGSNTAPFGPLSRVAGVAVATYWSQLAQACVPESRPSIAIDNPANGTSVFRGQAVPLHAIASDPFDITVSNISWTSDRQGALGSGNAIFATLRPGAHRVSATATNSQGLTRTASITVTVTSRPPTVRIATPADNAAVPADRAIQFSGTAVDPADGELPDASIVWRDNDTQFATGRNVSRTLGTEGDHTITLTATNAAGEIATAAITLHVGPPTGSPSPFIDSPPEGQNFLHGETTPVTFTGHATDPEDAVLTGTSLQWFDDYTDSGGIPHHVNFGSGMSAATTLYAGGTERPHTITLQATDSDGNVASVVRHVTSGAPG